MTIKITILSLLMFSFISLSDEMPSIDNSDASIAELPLSVKEENLKLH